MIKPDQCQGLSRQDKESVKRLESLIDETLRKEYSPEDNNEVSIGLREAVPEKVYQKIKSDYAAFWQSQMTWSENAHPFLTFKAVTPND